MRSIRVLMCALAISVITMGFTAHAGVPILINHQGRLLDASDHPVTGSRTLTFQIFDNPASMTPLWTEVHAGVTISEGIFNVTLGSLTPLSSEILAPIGSGEVPTAIERYLEVKVDADPPLSPRVRLVAAPYAVASSRISGDVETQPGTLSLKQTNTFHIRSAVETGHAEIVLDPGDGDGDPGDELALKSRKNKTYQKMTDTDIIGSRSAEISADSGGSSVTLESDADGDGLADNTSSQTVRTSGVSLAIKTKGTGAQRFALNLGAGTDSSSIESTFDENGDGHAERQFNTLSNASKCRTVCAADLNSDGNPEYTATQIADAAGARLAIKTKGTSAHRLSAGVSAGVDSSTVVCTYDENGDGVAEASNSQSCTLSDATTISSYQSGARQLKTISRNSLEHARTIVECDADGDGLFETSVTQTSTDSTAGVDLRYRAGTRVFCGVADRVAQGQLETDSDADGVMDNTISQVSADSTASVTVVSRFGSGPRQTVSQDGSFSHASHRTATDVDGDGTPESSTESYSDATTARIQAVRASINSGARVTNSVTATSALSEVAVDIDGNGTTDRRVSVNGSGAGSAIAMEDMGTQRFLLSPDSGLQQYNAAGSKTVDFDANGDGYVAGNMKFGLISGLHRIDVLGGAYCDGTNWVNASDANSKENFAPVDGRQILEKLNHLDITRWNYKGEADADHIGPTAQDFRQVFGVGSDGKSISTIDPSGIALAAIKELNKQNQQLRDQNQDLQNELQNLKKAVEKLQSQK